MAAAKTPRKSTTKKAEEVDLTKDQTPEEAEEAAALVAELTIDEDQTEGEALLANAIADDSVEAVPAKTKSVDMASASEDTVYRIKVLEAGLVVHGAFLLQGSTPVVPEAIYNQDDEEQIKQYGKVYFRKA